MTTPSSTGRRRGRPPGTRNARPVPPVQPPLPSLPEFPRMPYGNAEIVWIPFLVYPPSANGQPNYNPPLPFIPPLPPGLTQAAAVPPPGPPPPPRPTEVTLNQRFDSLDEAVLAFTRHSNEQSASYRVEKRDKRRLRLKCDYPTCPFHASVTAKGDYFEVVSLSPEHTCQAYGKKKRAASSRGKFIVDELKKVLDVTWDVTPQAIIDALKPQGIDITYHAAWNARRVILGDPPQQSSVEPPSGP